MLSAVRRAFREERVPSLLRWWCASEGIAFWLRLVERGLKIHLADRRAARRLLALAGAEAFRRRRAALAPAVVGLNDGEDATLALVIKGLYPGPIFRSIDFVLDELGGPARGLFARARARSMLAELDAEARWREVTVHLGELLIVLTEVLRREGVARGNSVLGAVCHDFGVWIATWMRRVLRLADTPESAIEVLRMGEYLFRVNPEHESGVGAGGTGYIAGNACPWYVRPGWGGMHCGIFGRFQDGCASVFGLNYRLTTTIPRHGGEVCRIDLKPIRLRRSRSDALGSLQALGAATGGPSMPR